MSFDPTKPVQTRDGRPARIIAANIKHPKYPIAAVYLGDSSLGDTPHEIVATYTKDGLYVEEDKRPVDLVNVPTKKEGWIIIYPSTEKQKYNVGKVWDSKEMAIMEAVPHKNKASIIHIEWEEV